MPSWHGRMRYIYRGLLCFPPVTGYVKLCGVILACLCRKPRQNDHLRSGFILCALLGLLLRPELNMLGAEGEVCTCWGRAGPYLDKLGCVKASLSVSPPWLIVLYKEARSLSNMAVWRTGQETNLISYLKVSGGQWSLDVPSGYLIAQNGSTYSTKLKMDDGHKNQRLRLSLDNAKRTNPQVCRSILPGPHPSKL